MVTIHRARKFDVYRATLIHVTKLTTKDVIEPIALKWNNFIIRWTNAILRSANYQNWQKSVR